MTIPDIKKKINSVYFMNNIHKSQEVGYQHLL